MNSLIDISSLTDDLIKFLLPFLPYLVKGGIEAGKSASQKLGEDAWSRAKEIWIKLNPKIKNLKTKNAIKNINSKSKQSSGEIIALRKELETILAVNNDLVYLFSTILKEAASIKKVHIIAQKESVVVNGKMSSSAIITGKVSGGVQNYTYSPIDIDLLFEKLKTVFSPDDPTPTNLLESLNTFRELHAQLSEWKYVHNYLNDILVSSDVFMLDLSSNRPMIAFEKDHQILLRLWKPVQFRVDIMQEWAENIKIIAIPFHETKKSLEGPKWALEVITSARLIQGELENKYSLSRRKTLLRLAQELDSFVKTHLYLADKQILTSVTNLEKISQIVFHRG